MIKKYVYDMLFPNFLLNKRLSNFKELMLNNFKKLFSIDAKQTKFAIPLTILSLMSFIFITDLNAQEGSGNWKKSQTNRKTSLYVPSGSTGLPSGYDHRGFMMMPTTRSGQTAYNNAYDPGHRFYVYVKSGETVYFSFRHASGNARAFDWYYDATNNGINEKFPVGKSGQSRTAVSNVSGNSSTNNNLTQTQTVVGPQPIRGNSGYSINNNNGGSFTNTTGADRAFWLEFSSSFGFEITDWDVTVVNNGEQQTGRVYTKYWSILNDLPGSGKNVTPNSGSFHDDFTFFVPIDNTETQQDDYFVKSINFGGANAGYVVFFANETGPSNDGTAAENRRSINDTSNLYHYPLFVADPDESLWPSSPLPAPIVDVVFKRKEPPLTGAEGHLTLHVEYPANVDILVDLDGDGVFSGNDVIISEYFNTPGEYTVIWNGEDANEDDVEYGHTVSFITSVGFFPVHFPVYDMEQSAGMSFENVRPGTPGAEILYWDHSGVTGGTTPSDSWIYFDTPPKPQPIVNVTGMDSPDENGEKWNKWYGTGDNGFGNNRTINAWTGASNHYAIKTLDFIYDEADLELKKEVDQDEVFVGEEVSFTITLRNLGISWATEVEVEDLLPSGLEYVSHTISVPSNQSNQYTTSTYNPTDGKWSVVTGTDQFSPGDRLILEVVAKVTELGDITNTATVDRPEPNPSTPPALEPDPDQTNNTASATVTGMCLTGTEQVNLSKSALSNSDLPTVGESLFFEDFGISDLNNGNKGRVESVYMPSNGFDFGNSYLMLPNPGGAPHDDNPIRNQARINDGFYAVVSPAYINEGWFLDDGWNSWWTPGYNESNPIYDYSGTENGAAMVINAGENLTSFYERNGIVQAGAKYRASFKLFLVQSPAQVGIDILDPITRDVIYTMQTDEFQIDFNNNNNRTWSDVAIEFTMPGSSCLGKEVIISFRNHYAEIDGNDWYMDNIRLEKIEDAPACPPTEECVTNGRTSVNLNDAFDGTPPNGTALVWYTTPDRSGTLVADPENVTESGLYYAFFYDAANDCFNTDISTAVVEVIIIPPCDLVIANSDIAQTPENTPVDGNVLTNDEGDEIKVIEFTYLDENGQTQTGSLNTPTVIYDENGDKAGTIKIDEEGNFTFTPEPGFTGKVPVNYTIEDKLGQTDDANLTIKVIPVYDPFDNNPPVANDDIVYTDKGENATGNVLTNDTDPDGDDLTVTQVEVPAQGGGTTTVTVPQDGSTVSTPVYQDGEKVGDLVIDKDGSFTFTPEPDFTGEVPPIEYTIDDGNGGTDTANLNVVVTEEPIDEMTDIIANDDLNSAPQGVAMEGDVSENDLWTGTNPEITGAVATVNGEETPLTIGQPTEIKDENNKVVATITLTEDGTYTYTPEPDFVGNVDVDYTVENTEGNEDSATLTLTSTPIKPVAMDDINQTQQGVDVSGNVLDNDYAHNEPLTVDSAKYLKADGTYDDLPVGTETDVYGYDENGDVAEAGTLTLNADGTYTFKPNEDFTGTVPVKYTAEDDLGYTDDAELSIKVIPTFDPTKNNPPVAQDDVVITDKNTPVEGDLLANDSDPDGDDLTVTEIEVPAQGGGTTTVAVPQDGTNTPSIPVYNEDGTEKIGELVINKDGNFTFTPEDGFVGEVPPIEYTIDDGNGGTDTADLKVSVVNKNVIGEIRTVDDAQVAPKGVAMEGDVSENDDWGDDTKNPKITEALVSVNGESVSFDSNNSNPQDLIVDGDKIGTLELDPATGKYEFIPEPDFTGNVNVVYTVTNDDGVEDTSTLYLTTLDIEGPTAKDDIVQTPENTPVTDSVLTNDDGDTIKVTDFTYLDGSGNPQAGSLNTTTDIYDEEGNKAGTFIIDEDGNYSFTPEPGFTGKVPVDYTIEDKHGQTDEANLEINVIPKVYPRRNNPPVANNDNVTTKKNVDLSGNILSNDSDPDGDDIKVTAAKQNGTPITVGAPTTVSGKDENGAPVANAGTLTLNPKGSFTFVPADDFVGTVDPIDYIIKDYEPNTSNEQGGEDSAVLNITVEDKKASENVTYANDDANTAPKGEAMTGNVLDNDFDPENHNQSLTEITITNASGQKQSISVPTTGDLTQDVYVIENGVPVKAGSLKIDKNGEYTFTPESDFVGTVVVEQRVCDSATPQACDKATLYLTSLDIRVSRLITNPHIIQRTR